MENLEVKRGDWSFGLFWMVSFFVFLLIKTHIPRRLRASSCYALAQRALSINVILSLKPCRCRSASTAHLNFGWNMNAHLISTRSCPRSGFVSHVSDGIHSSTPVQQVSVITFMFCVMKNDGVGGCGEQGICTSES